jgi:lipoprotein-anchoring transpeptidase ErfK/SrfK
MNRFLSPVVCAATVLIAWSASAFAYEGSFFLDTPEGSVSSSEPAGYPDADPSYAPSDADITQGQSPIPREVVAYEGAYPAGTIVVSTREKRLYLVLPDHQALRYGVGVGRPGFSWSGMKTITAKREWPDWTPPAAMIRRRPDLPRHMAGGLDNPLGARALYLGSSEFRIHGSNEPDTIGQAVSSGCIRMTNDDVADLYDRVKVGTRAIVQP